MIHRKRKWSHMIWVGCIIFIMTLTGCSNLLELQVEPSARLTSTTQLSDEFQALELEGNELDEFREVALFLIEHQQLPDDYLTKSEARKLGWVAQQGNLHEVAPGSSIGGDVFHNREGRLPEAQGRIWYEADIHYSGGARGADRIVFSNDGLIYMTRDHYQTFTRMDRGGG